MKKIENNKTIWEGLCFDILDELAERFNFRYEFYSHKYSYNLVISCKVLYATIKFFLFWIREII